MRLGKKFGISKIVSSGTELDIHGHNNAFPTPYGLDLCIRDIYDNCMIQYKTMGRQMISRSAALLAAHNVIPSFSAMDTRHFLKVSCVFFCLLRHIVNKRWQREKQRKRILFATSKAVADTINPTRYEPGFIVSMSMARAAARRLWGTRFIFKIPEYLQCLRKY